MLGPHIENGEEAQGLADACLFPPAGRRSWGGWRGTEFNEDAYLNERFGVHDVRFFLGVPKNYDRTKSWPLVVKLPAIGPFWTEPPPDGDGM